MCNKARLFNNLKQNCKKKHYIFKARSINKNIAVVAVSAIVYM